MIISVAGAAASIYFARYIYLKNQKIASSTATKFSSVYNLLLNKYFVDEVYDRTLIQPIYKTSESFLWKIADNKMIDGVVNGTASLVNLFSRYFRKIQTGVAQSYALIMMLGIAVALFWIIFR